jgi:alpha-beta hydrolase superfamily lysophospholipase
MAHFLGATREMGLDRFARRFNEAGYGVLVFDYRHLGASEGEPRQIVAFGRQQADWRAALDYVRTREDVDAAKVALWGPSMSAGNVMTVAATDSSVAAVVATAPFTDGVASVAALGPRQALRLAARALRDLWRMAARRPPFTIPVAGPPGGVAAMTTPDALQSYEALVPAGTEWRNELAARMVAVVATYRPVRKARRVRAPLLVQAFSEDRITPPGPSIRAAHAAPRGELKTYPGGHFAPFAEQFEPAVTDQLDFLRRHLGG